MLSNRSSSTVLLLATLAFAAAGLRYIEPDALPRTPKPGPQNAPSDVRFVLPMPATSVEIDEALEANPFSSTRTRPPARFGELAVGGNTTPHAQPDVRSIKLLGTTVAGPQSFAVLEEPGKPGRVVRLNEEFLGYTLRKIERGRVVLGSKDSTIVFDLNKGSQ